MKQVSDEESDGEGEDGGEDVVADGNLFTDDQTVEEFNSGYRKFWNEQQQKEKKRAGEERGDDGEEEEEENIDDMFAGAQDKMRQQLRQRIARLREEIEGGNVKENEEEIGHEEKGDEDEQEQEQGEQRSSELLPTDSLNFPVRRDEEIGPTGGGVNKVDAGKAKRGREKEVTVDPENFVSMEPKRLRSDLPEIVGYDDEDEANEDEEDDQRKAIAEAFADDDVVADFASEKKALVEAGRPKDIDLTLPGWGDWGGGGLMVSKRKRKRFTVKAPPAPKRLIAK